MTQGKETVTEPTPQRPTIRWDEQGLAPVIVQDARTGQVLTLAYANAEALAMTEKTGAAHFWSRSRNALWRKGETSGHTQQVIAIAYDCDADALLYQVIPNGPACHTGEQTCFYRTLTGRPSAYPQSTLARLEAIIKDRQANPREGSYTTALLGKGENEIVKKLGEEAIEVIVAAKGESDARVIYELADLVYHSLVLLAARGLAWTEVEDELAHRFK